jgi:hypothetical protein
MNNSFEISSIDSTSNENAKKFFDACETGKGWSVCKEFCSTNAGFTAQCEPLKEISTLEGYTDWMKGFAENVCKGCSYELQSWTTNKNQVVAFAVFVGTHNGDGGPCPATNKSIRSNYVYVMNMENGKVASMVKIWNAPWSMKDFGWC